MVYLLRHSGAMNFGDEGGVKLTIEKLGRIQRAELDIRPLTVLIGPNHTNKTWTAYVLYGLLQTLSRKLSMARFQPLEVQGSTATREARLREVLRPLLEAVAEGPAPTRVDLSLDARSLSLLDEEGLGSEFDAGALHSVLGVAPARVAEAYARIELLRAEFEVSIASMELSFERPLNRLQVKTHRRRRSVDASPFEVSTTLVSLADEAWTERKVLDVLAAQTSNLIENVIALPTERSGLLPLWPLISDSDRLELPLAVKDLGRFLAVAQTVAPVNARTAAQERLSRLLKRVMGGEIVYVTELGSKRLFFRTGTAEIPLQAAASLARAVACLALYIERFFQTDDVLIIDELEMNAHPQAQLALTEFVAALVNAGVRVVFTTHSPYVVDHLNNLMEASRVPEARREPLARRFALETPSSFISPEQVSVYSFQEQSPGGEVTVEAALNRETNLINWSTFSRVSEHSINLYGDILRTLEDEP